MKVQVEQDRCIGAGNCVLTAPGVFDQREEDGLVVLLQEYPPASESEAIDEAEILCPGRAITVSDDNR